LLSQWIVANYPHSREVIYSGPGGANWRNGRPHTYTGITRANHFDHVHWALLHGGPVDAGASYLVAEAQPELFVGQSGAAQILNTMQVFTPDEPGWIHPYVPETRPAPAASLVDEVHHTYAPETALLHGGPVDAGLSYLVGEVQPELFVGESGAAQILRGLQVFTPPETGWLYPQVPDTRQAPTLSAPWTPPPPPVPAAGEGGTHGDFSLTVPVNISHRGPGFDEAALRADLEREMGATALAVLERHQRDRRERTTRWSR